MAVQCKAYLYNSKPEKPTEIRRFTLDSEVATNYEYLYKKVSSLFPALKEVTFSLQWKDGDGDMVWFSTDEELTHALMVRKHDMIKIFIKINPPEKDNIPPSSSSGPDPRIPPPSYDFYHGRAQHASHGTKPPQFYQYAGFPPMFPPSYQASWGQQHFNNQQQQQQQQQHQYQQEASGEQYLHHVGSGVAEILRPLGIDVDVSVEHNGRRQQCSTTESQPNPSSGNTGAKTTFQSKRNENPKPGDADSKAHEPTNQAGNDTNCVQAEMERLEVSNRSLVENPRLAESLTQLLAMGFNNDGGWLANLLCACDYDISRALDKMQPARGSRG
uniref:sequestosome-1 isoform X2 n=1 Tax=Ciona intestinalis TaxID=7719 RepID=UPI00089DAB7D|nr:sequestosome-1 isoform X2 [Ciona intestinalis]|eukprot:XP_026691570.1 sequestosome-1 isoform X2 [Ciona intestinalis]